MAAFLLVAVAAIYATYRTYALHGTHLSDGEASAKAKEFLLKMPCTFDEHIEHRFGEFVDIERIEVLQKSYEGSQAIVQLGVSYRGKRNFDDPSREGLCFGSDLVFTRYIEPHDDEDGHRSSKARAARSQINLLFTHLEDGWWVGGTTDLPFFHPPMGSDPP